MASKANLGPLERSSDQFYNFKVEDKKRKDLGYLTKASQREDIARQMKDTVSGQSNGEDILPVFMLNSKNPTKSWVMPSIKLSNLQKV